MVAASCLQRLIANPLPTVPAGSDRSSPRWQHVAADDHIDQQLNDHIQALMQTLTPLRPGRDAGVRGGSAPERETCNGSATIPVSQACAVESDGLCKTHQPGDSNPPPAAHVLHHDPVPWGPPSAPGVQPTMSPRPAPQDSLATSQGHCWQIDTSPILDDTVLNLDKTFTCPYRQSWGFGAQQQLQALHHTDGLQQATMEHNMVGVSHPANLDCPLKNQNHLFHSL